MDDKMKVIDRENVIKGLYAHGYRDCKSCPYWGTGNNEMSACRQLAREAYALLKEQEPVKPKTGHWIESKCLDDCFWVCSECDFPSEALAAPKLYKYCPNCGIKMEGQQ